MYSLIHKVMDWIFGYDIGVWISILIGVSVLKISEEVDKFIK